MLIGPYVLHQIGSGMSQPKLGVITSLLWVSKSNDTCVHTILFENFVSEENIFVKAVGPFLGWLDLFLGHDVVQEFNELDPQVRVVDSSV